jgi:hypothetical protein
VTLKCDRFETLDADPDPHLDKKLDPDLDPDADPQHCLEVRHLHLAHMRIQIRSGDRNHLSCIVPERIY